MGLSGSNRGGAGATGAPQQNANVWNKPQGLMSSPGQSAADAQMNQFNTLAGQPNAGQSNFEGMTGGPMQGRAPGFNTNPMGATGAAQSQMSQMNALGGGMSFALPQQQGFGGPPAISNAPQLPPQDMAAHWNNMDPARQAQFANDPRYSQQIRHFNRTQGAHFNAMDPARQAQFAADPRYAAKIRAFRGY